MQRFIIKDLRQVFQQALNYLAAIFLLLLLITSSSSAHHGSVDGRLMTGARTDADAPQWNVFYRFLRSGRKHIWKGNHHFPQCLWQGVKCDPWLDECCPGMSCLNFARGYCLGGLEKCICFPTHTVDFVKY